MNFIHPTNYQPFFIEEVGFHMLWYVLFAVLLYYFGWIYFTRALFTLTLIFAYNKFAALCVIVRLINLYFLKNRTNEILVNEGMVG